MGVGSEADGDAGSGVGRVRHELNVHHNDAGFNVW
jgi:hypothetical protein